MSTRAMPTGIVRCGDLPGWADVTARDRASAIALGHEVGSDRVVSVELAGLVWLPEQCVTDTQIVHLYVPHMLENLLREGARVRRYHAERRQGLRVIDGGGR